MPEAQPPRREAQVKWAQWALGSLGVLLLAAGMFVSGGWPILIPGFACVIVAASLR